MKNLAGFSGSMLANDDIERAHADIDAAERRDGKLLAVHGDLAWAAGVDGAEFAAFEEDGAAGFLVVGECDGRGGRDGAGDDEAVEIGEDAMEGAGLIDVRDEEGIA